MAKTLQIGFAAVLMSASVALAFPAYAASKAESTKDTAASTTDLSHTSTKAAGLKGKRLSAVDAKERKITAELNREAMSGKTAPGRQSSLDTSTNSQQAAAEPENSPQ